MSRWLDDDDRMSRWLRRALLAEAAILLGNVAVYSTLLLVMEVLR